MKKLGRPPSSDLKIPKMITLTEDQWKRIDELKKSMSRGDWILSKIKSHL
jgi:hypothetical protein